MSKVFFDVAMSLDGYIAGPNRGPRNPLGDRGTTLHNWMFQTATFRRMIGLAGGETGEDDAVVRAVFERAGAYVMGRHMFEEGWDPDSAIQEMFDFRYHPRYFGNPVFLRRLAERRAEIAERVARSP